VVVVSCNLGWLNTDAAGVTTSLLIEPLLGEGQTL